MELKSVIRNRTLWLGLIMTFLFFLLLFRVFWLQTAGADIWLKRAESAWSRSDVLEPMRGNIYDRNGDLLAYTGPAYIVAAEPDKIKDKWAAARALSPILKMDVYRLVELLSKTGVKQVEIRPTEWKIDKETADKVEALKINGVFLIPDKKRYYPNQVFASQVLGYVNQDNQAVMGLEKSFDDILKGEKGELSVIKDAKGYALPDGQVDFRPAKDGDNVYLTIDETIQQYVESALDKAEKALQPERLLAIVVDPDTGEILAMANRPTFNPNKYWNIKDFQNDGIQSQFEPGSTFKIVTLSAAVEEGYYDNNKTFMSGSIRVPGATISDWNGSGWGRISYLEGVEHSSNVLFVKLGYEMLGKEKLFDYIRRFGFGEKTGIDLPGEAKGILFGDNAYPSEVATTAFGQGVSVTPIQQVAAVSAVANGGELLKPYIVKGIRDPKTGEVIKQNHKTVVRRVIKEETAKEVRAILQDVVDSGSGGDSQIPGYEVAGKTGTAQKVGPNGKYLENSYIASFIGFAPASNPRLVVYVAVDSPKLDIPYYGSTVAAPIFKEILQNSLRYLGVPPKPVEKTADKREKLTSVPDVVDRSLSDARTLLQDKGLKFEQIGKGSKILAQFPQEGAEILPDQRIYLVTEPKEKLVMPSLQGLSLRDALEIAHVYGLELTFQGEGYVTEQSVAAGTPLSGVKQVSATLQPLSRIETETQSDGTGESNGFESESPPS